MAVRAWASTLLTAPASWAWTLGTAFSTLACTRAAGLGVGWNGPAPSTHSTPTANTTTPRTPKAARSRISSGLKPARPKRFI